jgi:single-strand DNA-binding protein
MNKVILIGNLGRDPELTYTQTGTAKCKFSIATSKVRKDKAGEKTETTFWHAIVVWGNQAEACGKYLAKGRKVAVEGEIETREYEQDGQRKWMTEINAQHVEFLGGPSDGQRDRAPDEGGGNRAPQRDRQEHRAPAARKPAAPPPPVDDDDDSIPF